jgi:hypothetical protein
MRTIREEVLGKSILRLVETGKTYGGIILVKGERRFQTSGASAEEVWKCLRAEVGKFDANFFGFDGAIARFQRIFPKGLRSEAYVKRERAYKIAAKERLDQIAAPEKARTVRGLGEAMLGVYRATNLLAPIESTRMQALLRGADADSFVQAAARFCLGDLGPALAGMKAALAKHNVATWPAATYLPYLWRPDVHMFLKPKVTKDFSTRVGHDFVRHYDAQLEVPVYESLIDLAKVTAVEIAELRPRDQIDVQSFIWVVGEYDE